MSAPTPASRLGDVERAPRGYAPDDDISVSIFDLEPGTCPQCFGPIEPERLPGAALCLDCVVER